jgi:uncharacterized protein (TIGR02145 family)
MNKNIKCFLGLHDWSKDCAQCSKCGMIRDKQHDWSKDCEKCSKCEKIRENKHSGKGFECIKCGKPFPQGAFEDARDKRIYKWVRIGEQIWMAENLNYDAGKGCCFYRNKRENGEKYGRLYNWETAMNSCPQGWHIPTDQEWTVLTDFLGGVDVASGKLKEAGISNWVSPNKGATNESGFSALPGGVRNHGKFRDIGVYSEWWSSTQGYPGDACYRGLSAKDTIVTRYGGTNIQSYLYVRCIKD